MWLTLEHKFFTIDTPTYLSYENYEVQTQWVNLTKCLEGSIHKTSQKYMILKQAAIYTRYIAANCFRGPTDQS